MPFMSVWAVSICCRPLTCLTQALRATHVELLCMCFAPAESCTEKGRQLPEYRMMAVGLHSRTGLSWPWFVHALRLPLRYIYIVLYSPKIPSESSSCKHYRGSSGASSSLGNRPPSTRYLSAMRQQSCAGPCEISGQCIYGHPREAQQWLLSNSPLVPGISTTGQ